MVTGSDNRESENGSLRPRKKRSKTHFLKSVYLWLAVLGLAGLVCLLFGVQITPPFEKGVDPNGFEKLGSSFFKELGFALIIAALVISLIELRARREHLELEETAKEEYNDLVYNHIEQITRSLFSAVYKRKFDESYVDLIDDVLNRRFFVDEYNFTITLSESDAVVDGRKLLCVDFHYSYVVRNISSESGSFEFRLEIERPTLAGSDYPAQIREMVVGGKSQRADEIEQADEADPDTSEFKRYRLLVPIEPGDSRAIEVSAVLYKAYNDEFSWRAFTPTASMDVDVVVQTAALDISGIGVVAYSPEPVLARTGPASYKIDIARPLLPGNGFAIWWTDKQKNKGVVAREAGAAD